MIVNLPHRAPEIGRLSFGEVQKVKNKKGEMVDSPARLETWRARSLDEMTLLALASIYGGTVKASTRTAGYEVVTESAELNVLLPPDPFSAFYELWSKAGCQRRCSGETCMTPQQTEEGGHLVEVDCMCRDEGKVPGEDKDACTVNVRLKVVLPDVPGLGIWLVNSGSINAAMELPAQVQLMEAMAQRGALVPAVLALENREKKKPWEKYVRKFGVPVLRVRQSLAQLANGSHPELERSAPSAVEALPPPPAALPAAPAAPSPEQSPLRAAQTRVAEVKAAGAGPIFNSGVKKGQSVTDVKVEYLRWVVSPESENVNDEDKAAAFTELEKRNAL